MEGNKGRKSQRKTNKRNKEKKWCDDLQNKHDETANDSASSSRSARSFAVAAGSI